MRRTKGITYLLTVSEAVNPQTDMRYTTIHKVWCRLRMPVVCELVTARVTPACASGPGR